MINYDLFFEEKITSLKSEGRYRTFIPLERCANDFPHAKFHMPSGQIKKIIVWCSNDYLGQSQDATVIEEMKKSLENQGTGAGGTRNISGNNHLHLQLEKELAQLHKKESCLIFSSGYVANWTTLSTLARHLPECMIFSDEKNHNSMIEGMRHTPHVIRKVWSHNDPKDLKRLLSQAPSDTSKIVAMESLYSMDGDICPLEEILDLCQQYHALSYLDEVHAVGLYGAHGAGIAEEKNLMERVDIIQGTLAKAFGVVGGYIAGSAPLIDFIRSFGNGFIFTTSLPPFIAAGCLASIKGLKESSQKRIAHQKQAQKLKDQLKKNGFPIKENHSHIVPLMVYDASLCQKISEILLHNHHIYAQPINYPTVAKGQERLRLTPTPFHTDEMIHQLVQALKAVWSQLNIPL